MGNCDYGDDLHSWMGTPALVRRQHRTDGIQRPSQQAQTATQLACTLSVSPPKYRLLNLVRNIAQTQTVNGNVVWWDVNPVL